MKDSEEVKEGKPDVIKFLLGESKFEDLWFHEKTTPPFWWRKRLREYDGNLQSQLSDIQKENETLKAWKESAITNFLDPIITYGQTSSMPLGASIIIETIKRAKERDSLVSQLNKAKELLTGCEMILKTLGYYETALTIESFLGKNKS